MEATGGTLDALFNNGAFSMRGAVEDVPTAALREIFETNFFGYHSLTVKAVAVMRKQGDRGHIIQHSSGFGLLAGAFNMCYCATKFALEAHSQSLRQELFGTDIKVVLLNIGLSELLLSELLPADHRATAVRTVQESPSRRRGGRGDAAGRQDPRDASTVGPILCHPLDLARSLPCARSELEYARAGLAVDGHDDGGHRVKDKAAARELFHPVVVLEGMTVLGFDLEHHASGPHAHAHACHKAEGT